MKIPFLNFEPMHNSIRSEIMQSFLDVYDANWFVMGKKLESFEKEYAAFNNTKYSIGVSNGLDALHLSLKSLNVTKDDEVIVPSNTYIATALAVSYVGATPVLVEPDANTLTASLASEILSFSSPAAIDNLAISAGSVALAISPFKSLSSALMAPRPDTFMGISTSFIIRSI
jgi:histidinol-phosphate/aromatic aminotransferase/cobyric acid decarboxylase-like protein